MEKKRSEFSYRNLFTGITVSSLTFLAALLIPILGTAIIVLTPLPIIYYFSKTGRIQGLAVLMLSLLVVTLIMTLYGQMANVPVLYLSGCAGIILSEFLKKNCSIEKTVSYPVIALIALWFLFILFHSTTLGKHPWHLIENHISENLRDSIQFYAQIGTPEEQLNHIKDNVQQITRFFTNIFPALLVASVIFTVWINILMAREIFRKYKIPFPDFGDLSLWKTPDSFIWLLIVSGAMILAPVEGVSFVGLNLLIICLFVYLLQGLSITSFLFRQKNIPKLIRILFYFFVFVQQYIALFITAIGVFDLWFDFRKYIKPISDSTT